MAEGAQPGPGPEAQSTGATFRPRKDAVLVFGATGRLGTEVVSEVRLMPACSLNMCTFC